MGKKKKRIEEDIETVGVIGAGRKARYSSYYEEKVDSLKKRDGKRNMRVRGRRHN